MEYFFWRFGDLKKHIALSEKKPPLVSHEFVILLMITHFVAQMTISMEMSMIMKIMIMMVMKMILVA